MSNSICGVDCTECTLRDNCGGCAKTKGHPFGGPCAVAVCCQNKGHAFCSQCLDLPCKYREELIAEFNALGLGDMDEITSLNSLKGSFVNLEYTLANGQTVKLLDDDTIYLGNQIGKKNSDRCYGLAADEHYLLVCEYGEGGSEPEIIEYRKRRG